MDTENLRNPGYFINRELSWLAFNERVLALAEDERVPLLERLRFLCISSNNLDEFFEIRVAGLKQLIELGRDGGAADGRSASEQLEAIHAATVELMQRQYQCLNEDLLPALRETGVVIAGRSSWSEEEHRWLERYFETEVEPVLSPLGLDPARPFPRIQNKSLNFIARLDGKDAFGRDSEYAVVQAPRSLPRVVPLPAAGASKRFVLLSAVIQEFVPRLFEGVTVLGCYAFRVTRNSDLLIDEDDVDDLRRALEGELLHRRYGAAVRLEVWRDCPAETTDYLLRHFALGADDLYYCDGPVNLNRLATLYDLVQRTDLKYPPFTAATDPRLRNNPDFFAVLRQQDVLLHHPFQSFTPVVDLLRQAARDPNVLAIKQTLYRTGVDSPMAAALLEAAANGKDVTVVIELRARFDEEANIELSNRLQEAGAHVMYGVVGYKTHAKALLIVRREESGIRRYCHLGTGNYHPQTARAYTDYGLMSADQQICQDVHEIFLQLTSLTKSPRLTRLIQAPFGLHAALCEKIRREADHARAGRSARIIAKVNALLDTDIIVALYEASRAGVSIDLIVRGICALRPQVPGVSENIRVRSIVGRFLEHSRVYYFANDGQPDTLLASADWMPRNFFARVEIAFPVLASSEQARIVADLETYLWDNCDAWELGQDGSYRRLQPGEEPVVSAQNELLSDYAQL
ncbi:MAG: polyphosphate kinase 1 [Steroidobacteraceae bacterium]